MAQKSRHARLAPAAILAGESHDFDLASVSRAIVFIEMSGAGTLVLSGVADGTAYVLQSSPYALGLHTTVLSPCPQTLRVEPVGAQAIVSLDGIRNLH